MATVDHLITEALHLPPDLDASLWFTRLDDVTDPGEAIRSALASQSFGTTDAGDRLLIFRTVVGLMRQVEGPGDDEESWRDVFRGIDAGRPDRPLFGGHV